jgi:hypothetical protein
MEADENGLLISCCGSLVVELLNGGTLERISEEND